MLNTNSYRVPEESFVELDLKVLFQETGITPSVTSEFLQKHKTLMGKKKKSDKY